MGIFPDAQGQLTPHSSPWSDLVRNFIHVLVSCYNENDSIKNEENSFTVNGAKQWNSKFSSFFVLFFCHDQICECF